VHRRAQINFATLVIAFFATSAIFHFWALVAGAYEYWCARAQAKSPHPHARAFHVLTPTLVLPCPAQVVLVLAVRCWPSQTTDVVPCHLTLSPPLAHTRQMDDAFCFWRWAEYSISASIMASL
jgi:hypothetical protein